MQSRSEEFNGHATECEEVAKQYDGLIKEQYQRLSGQWSFLAKRPLIVTDPVLLCVASPSRR